MKYAIYFGLMACCVASVQAEIDPNDVTFVFYNRENFNGVRITDDEHSSLVQIRHVFDPKLPIVVLIHGWQDNYEADSNTYVRHAVLSKTNVNLIKVDWSPLSRQGYFAARDAVPFVGKEAADLLRSISNRFSYDLRSVTLTGFSLGAHIAGNIGKNLPGKIGLIIALDPAGPFISSSDKDFCVHPTDAHYVQSIHTNAGTLGMSDPVGHADFYPNGGSRQPGCGLDLVGGCAHNRAWEYFAESLGQNRFAGVSCESWDAYRRGRCSQGEVRLMGGLNNVDKMARGNYYLETNAAPPFGQH